MKALRRLKVFIRKPQGFFLTVSLIFGGVFLVTIPPLQTPDEASHFLRVYQVAHLGFLPTTSDGIVGGELPKSLSKTIELLDTKPSLRFHAETKYDLHRTKAALNIPLDKENTRFTSGVTSYSPVGYIPQSIGVLIGSWFNLPVVALMYIARLMSLIAWVTLIFLAIKITPQKKWAFVGIALLPMLVAQAVSPGIDAISIGLGVLFIATVLKLRAVDRIGVKWWAMLLAIAALVALTKQTTVVVIAFAFLLHVRQFDTVKWKAMCKKALLFVTPVALFVTWTLLISHFDLSGSSNIPGQDSTSQVANIVHNPLRFPQVLFNTFFTTWGDGVVQSFIGNFGWMDTPLAAGFINLGYIFIAFVLIVGYESKVRPLPRLSKWLIGLLVGIYLLGTCLALYLFYSPVDFDIIYGLQGRYFLLALFMVIPLCAKTVLKISEKKYVRAVAIGSSLLLTVSLITIWLRYYIELF